MMSITGQPSRRTRLDRVLVPVCRLLVLAAALGLWQLAANRGWISDSRYASPAAIWDELVKLSRRGDLWRNVRATLTAMLLALVIAVPTGILAGLALAAFPFVDRVLSVFLVPINSIPRIALAPLFIVWFGLTISAKVALAGSIVFFMVLFNARAGIKNVDPDMIVVSRLLTVPRWQIFAKVVLPASVPTIFAGIRLAVTYSLLGVVASEMIAARSGLGLLIVRFGSQFNVAGVFAVLTIFVAIAIALGFVLDLVERRLLRWQ